MYTVIAEGLNQGEPGLVAIFEEMPVQCSRWDVTFGPDFDTPEKKGMLEIIPAPTGPTGG